MAIRDMSNWPDDQVPAFVLRHRIWMRGEPERERKRLERSVMRKRCHLILLRGIR